MGSSRDGYWLMLPGGAWRRECVALFPAVRLLRTLREVALFVRERKEVDSEARLLAEAELGSKRDIWDAVERER